MATFAVVDASGLIVNRVTVEEGSDWTPPAGHIAVPGDDYAIGGTYIDGVYAPPEPLPIVPTGDTTVPQNGVLFDHENRLREIEGLPPITLEAFKQ